MHTGTEESGDLLVPANFLRAVRESGYLSISTALAELIDNSIEAAASAISITIARHSAESMPEISVEDNGRGMSEAELKACLRFGGSSRFNARDSLGRFGMGLPAASLSQARRIEVVSWQGSGPEARVVLDVDAVVSGAQVGLNVERSGQNLTPSGCKVRWEHCDRIEYQRLGWLERVLRRDLGRMFRRFLWSGTNITINGEPVIPVDPMMLTDEAEGARAQLACDPMEFAIEKEDGKRSIVTVRFASLPVAAWHHLDNATKRKIGVIGKAGVSILRGGREIANGWHLMGSKRKENYDDWWRCEIEFEPQLDEQFGITINKQGVRPSSKLRHALEPELEAIARLLNNRVRRSFEEAKIRAATEAACSIAAAADRDLPLLALNEQTGPMLYRIEAQVLPMDTMFRTDLDGRTITLVLNSDHPVFEALYLPLQKLAEAGSSNLRTSVELLLLALARSVIQQRQSGQDLDALLDTWSGTYQRMLQRT
ncbi:ATP-binding protein [Nesterenkonia jeotgali]|uniref:Anti-sigma regulatory factor (Ser/Thr protein kinase) n=1 Tax=Nesterenkonia jeotgali TaxID=317018 RepID=A0A839FR19_9MICC|nr:ATP-binding protein [Nesterenkonia jeotgali]MBA8920383.1 anti-sigma regulatory factor (Ser/Thr protein kinase) [Nesterenkonia jeotgali]